VARKVLALVAEPISADELRSALGDDAEQVEVKVVAPAFDSKTRFWTSDSDEAIARADAVQRQSVVRLGEGGVDAEGDTGESDPLLAVQDALATFPAEEIVICAHPAGDRNWAEDELVELASERFDVPVRQIEVRG
jgi:hypothetical protein